MDVGKKPWAALPSTIPWAGASTVMKHLISTTTTVAVTVDTRLGAVPSLDFTNIYDVHLPASGEASR